MAGWSSADTTAVMAGPAARYQILGTVVRSERAPTQMLDAPATRNTFPSGLAQTWCGEPSSRYAALPARKNKSARHHEPL